MEAVTNEILLERLTNFSAQNGLDHDFIRKSIDEMSEHFKETDKSISSLKLWRSFLTGISAVLVTIVVPLALMLFSVYINKK